MHPILHHLIRLVYPNNCAICNESLVKGEEAICTSCLFQLPKTNYHENSDNEIERRFWGKVHLEAATAYYHFDKGAMVQKLLHQLKYKGNQEIGVVLGRQMANSLKNTVFNEDIDLIVPVPLHKKTLQKRGYNQSTCIAEGIAEVFGKDIDTKTLIRVQENSTQTKKGVFERWENSQGIFDLKDATLFENKHILLIDDVLTTGSTLESCAQAILQAKGSKVSILSLAVA